MEKRYDTRRYLSAMIRYARVSYKATRTQLEPRHVRAADYASRRALMQGVGCANPRLICGANWNFSRVVPGVPIRGNVSSARSAPNLRWRSCHSGNPLTPETRILPDSALRCFVIIEQRTGSRPHGDQALSASTDGRRSIRNRHDRSGRLIV